MGKGGAGILRGEESKRKVAAAERGGLEEKPAAH